jgi:SAM-dependent methyltransferase
MKTKTPWWESQFQDPVIIQIMFGWKTNTKAEVDQILKQMNLPTGARILDLACGQGRHSIELAKRGFQVTGLDYSPLLLTKARSMSKKVHKTKRPTFIEGDMRNLKRLFTGETFDAVINLWNAWGYFDRRSDDLKTLKGISHVLAPGGKLVINTLNEGGVIQRIENSPPRWHEETKGQYFLQKFDYDRLRKKLNARWILVAPKKKLEKHYSFSQNVYSTQDFRKELRSAGLKMAKLWGMIEGKPYSEKSWHQTFVARKLK